MNVIKKLTDAKKSNYMMRTAFLLSVLLIILIAIFSCIITIFFSYRTDAMYTNLNSRALKQLAEFTDKYVFENVDYLCETYFNKDAEYEPAKRFFNNMENMSRDEMQSIQKDLFKIKKHNSFLNGIYLYNSRFDSFISTNDGIVFGASDPRNNFTIESRFFSYLDSINTDFYVPQDDNIMVRNQDGLIIYVHYVSTDEITVLGRKHVSCVIMVIEVENIINFLNQVNMPGIQSFAIMDKNQKALIHSSNFPDVNQLVAEDGVDFKEILASKSGSMTRDFIGKRSNYTWIKSDVHDWTYVYILSLSDNYRNILIVSLSVMILAFIIIAIGQIAIRLYTKKLYQPFNITVQKAIENLDGDEHSDNEIEILNYLIDKFNNRKKEYEDMYKQYSYVSLNAAALDIIRGFTPNNNDSILERLSSYGVDFSRQEYGFVLIEFNPSILSTFTVNQSDFVLYDVMDALKATFNCVITVSTNNTVELVVNYDKIDYSRIITKLKKLIPEKSFINVYYSPVTTKLYEVSKCHEKSLAMMKYSYLYGFDNVFNTTELEMQDLDNRIIDEKEIALVESLLKEGSKEQFYDECNRILADVKTNKHSYSYAQNVVLKIFSILCRIIKEYDVELEYADEFKKITNNKNFDNTTIYLFEFADKLFDKISNKDYERKFDLINSIKKFIKEHITEDISQASVAQQFNISAGYLSKFFKENTGQAFSKYIIEKKFAYAAEALIKHPEKSISDIANDFGYFDTAYFSRQFKTHHGVTPIQYRRLNQHINN